MVFLQIVGNLSFFSQLLLLIYFCEHTWAEVLVTHTLVLWHTLGTVYKRRHAGTRTHTPTHTHTHTWARAGDAKKAIEKFIVVVDSDAWLDSGAGLTGEQGEHVFLSILKRVFSAPNCFTLYVCFIFWFNWEFLSCCCYQFCIYYFADLLFLSLVFLLVCCTNCWALFETLDERQLSKTRQLRKIVRPVWLYPNDLMRSTQLFTRPWTGAEPAAAAASVVEAAAKAAAAEPHRQTGLNSQSFQPEDA